MSTERGLFGAFSGYSKYVVSEEMTQRDTMIVHVKITRLQIPNVRDPIGR
jgi:hypothetical protein